MRILFVTQLFDPEPHFKALPFVLELKRRGHEVRVITGFPNYPGGKVYPGYKIRPWQHEVMDGIPVLRVALYPSHNQNAVQRIATYASFGVSSAIAVVTTGWRPDVVYAYHAPATIALPAIAAKYLRDIPFVYDINDLWPDSLTATGMVNSRAALKAVAVWSHLTYRAADRLVVIAPGLKGKLVERGVPEEKISVIYNWCDQKALVPAGAAPEAGFEEKFVIAFAGNMGIAQDLDTVIDAAKIIVRRHPQVCFAMVGSGVSEGQLRKRVEDEGVANVKFLGRRPPSAMGPIFARADALLVHLLDDPLFAISIPSKTQAYMAAGKPIIMGVRGDAADLVLRANAGVTCIPEGAESLAEAVNKIVAMSPIERVAMGESGRRYYEQHLSLSAGVAAYENEFQRAIGGS